jgi:hypothetical protein
MHIVELADLDPLDDGERTEPLFEDELLDDDEEEDDDDLFGAPPGSDVADPEDDDW